MTELLIKYVDSDSASLHYNNYIPPNATTPNNQLVTIDLFDSVAMPITYTIADVREPDKRKTSYSKTIKIPKTHNNNRIFNHVYEISGASTFNTNLRTEVILLQDGLTILRGSMQLKMIYQDSYDVIITGDFSTLFGDLGLSKLSDLPFSEYDHDWTRDNIVQSWDGNIRLSNDNITANVINGASKFFSNPYRDTATGRVQFITSTPHQLVEGDWIRVYPNTSDTGWEYIKGDYQVVEVVSEYTFKINYLYPQGLLFTTVGGYIKKRRQLGFGYAYPMISWGDDSIVQVDPNFGLTTLPIFPVTSFIPSFYVKEIIDKIFKKTGSTYESDFLNSELFNRLIITQRRKEWDLPTTEVRSREFNVANLSPTSLRIAGFGANNWGSFGGETRSFPNNTTFPQAYPFPTTTDTGGTLYNGDAGSVPFNTYTNKWEVTDSGKYTFNFILTLGVMTSISNYQVSGTYDPPIDPEFDDKYDYFFGGLPQTGNKEDVMASANLYKVSGTVKTLIDSKTVRLLSKNNDTTVYATPVYTTYRDWVFPQKEISFTVNEMFLNKNDKVYVEVSYFGNFDNNNRGLFTQYYDNGEGQNPRYTKTAFRGTLDITKGSAAFFSNKSEPYIGENSRISMEQFLPKDILAKDFLLDIIKMFNLYIEPDIEKEKTYKIEPRPDYYNDGSNGVTDYVDWSDKVDVKSIDITPMGELTAKFYNFKYRDDSDYWNKKYLDDVGVTYGSYLKEVESDFLKNELKIQLTTIGSTVMINSPEETQIVIPQVVERSDGANSVMNTTTKILIWGGIRPTSINGIAKKWFIQRSILDGVTNLEDDLFTFYPYAGTTDSPFDPMVDLNFYYTEYVYYNRGRWSNDNLYNHYWKSFIDEISDSDSKLLKMNIFLTAKDIDGIDFKKIYIIDGNYLRLQKIIDYNASKPALTACEFLKLRTPSKFKRRSINVSEIDIEEPGITTGVTKKAPKTFKEKYKKSPGISGRNNIIAKKSDNISIQGDENYIGSESSNISITGNGMFIAGGVKNVTVIGTDNRIIESSNVSYINGVRYVNGVAISKSNVINGSVDNLSRNNKTNTSTIIDAGEDTVIDLGLSPVNVVDGGVNRILNDMGNYNITTLNNSNPTTNNSGVAIKPQTRIVVDDLIPPYEE